MPRDEPTPRVVARKREPLYKGMFHALRRRIELGQLPPGSRAPSESELIGEFSVSSTTARRCLNELEVAGYVERRQGKGTFVRPPPALARCRQIGVLYNELLSLTDIFQAHVLRGIGTALQRDDFQPTLLGLGLIHRSSDPRAGLLELVRRHDVEGLLVLSPTPLPWLTGVLDEGLPVASINFGYDDPRIFSAEFDPDAAHQQVAQRLEQFGHRRVLTVRRVFPAQLLEGVRLSRPHLEHPSSIQWINESFEYFRPDPMAQLLDRHFRGPEPPTAMVAYGYELALEMRELTKAGGKSIPQDVSLMFIGVPAGPTDLSGVILPVEDLGHWATKTVLDQVSQADPTRPQQQILAGRPHEGSTVGPAKR